MHPRHPRKTPSKPLSPSRRADGFTQWVPVGVPPGLLRAVVKTPIRSDTVGGMTPIPALIVLRAVTAVAASTYANPINLNYRFQLDLPSRREAADPTMVVYDDAYWLFASKSGGYWRSTDLVDWQLIVPTGLPLEDYAPTVVVINNTLFFTAFSSKAVFTTTDPLSGTWTKAADIGSYGDPALFFDDATAQLYVAFGCSDTDATQIVQLDPADGWKEVGERVPAARGNGTLHGWETPGDENEIDGKAPWIEGSWINKRDGVYYLQFAGPGTQYKSCEYRTFSACAAPLTRVIIECDLQPADMARVSPVLLFQMATVYSSVASFSDRTLATTPRRSRTSQLGLRQAPGTEARSRTSRAIGGTLAPRRLACATSSSAGSRSSL